MSQEDQDMNNIELMNNNMDLSDIQLLNEYEKKISKDIVELEKKMQEFKKWVSWGLARSSESEID